MWGDMMECVIRNEETELTVKGYVVVRDHGECGFRMAEREGDK
jgi:hypothetical protein